MKIVRSLKINRFVKYSSRNVEGVVVVETALLMSMCERERKRKGKRKRKLLLLNKLIVRIEDLYKHK